MRKTVARTIDNQRSARGFTIVEVLIVLAVAGIILSIVFAALPALGRNSRNNQRKTDVQAILAATSQYELNNSGGIPSTPNLQSFLNSYYKNKLTFYDVTQITVPDSTAPNGLDKTSSAIQHPANTTGLDNIQIYNHAKCDTDPSNQGSYTNAGASYSDVVALYSIETSSTSEAPKCQQL